MCIHTRCSTVRAHTRGSTRAHGVCGLRCKRLRIIEEWLERDFLGLFASYADRPVGTDESMRIIGGGCIVGSFGWRIWLYSIGICFFCRLNCAVENLRE